MLPTRRTLHIVGMYNKNAHCYYDKMLPVFMVATRSNFSKSLGYIPLGKNVEIVHFDGRVLALNKPYGLLSHPNDKRSHKMLGEVEKDSRAIVLAPYHLEKECFMIDQIDESGHHFATKELFLLNRLDSATSGVLLLSECPKTAAIVKELLHSRKVTKTYIAKVFGRLHTKDKPGTSALVWKNLIELRHIGRNSVRATPHFVDRSGGKDSKRIAQTMVSPFRGTGMEPQATSNVPYTSLLELQPLTGFTHQIRCQSAIYGLPIVGDKIYGDFQRNRAYQSAHAVDNPQCQRLFLHSNTVSFSYRFDGTEYAFSATAPIPTNFF